MKLLDYLMKLPFGEVVNKRALAVFKRCGYIYDYSHWVYLESCWLKYKDEGDDDVYRHLYEVFSKRNAPKDKHTDKVYTRDEFHEVYGDTDKFEYKGMFFKVKYYSGCFQPYLIKVEPPMKVVNGRRVPKKRLYYRGYKCAFKHEGYTEDIFHVASHLETKLHRSSYGKAFTYACHKTCTKGTRFRVLKKSHVYHGMCLWGAVI